MKREIATVKEQYVLLQNIFGYVPSLTMCQDVNKKIDVIQEKLQDALIIVTFVTIKDNIAIFIENIWTKSISENFYKLTTISKKIGFLEILGTKLMQVNTSDQLKICIENVNFYLKTSINQKKIDINVPLDKTIQLPLIETKNKIATILKNLSDLTYNIIDFNKGKKIIGNIIKLSYLPYDKDCYIYAFNTVIFDQDIKNSSKNLVIIGPKWQVLKYLTIDLSGNNAFSPHIQKASNGGYCGAAGYDGTPGTCGKNSGHFLGIGDEFINMERLTIKTNGGNGGNAQNGGDGVDGKNGQDAQCITRSDKFTGSYKTDYGLTFCITRDINIYQRNGEIGGTGGNGGMGGGGGIAGKAGAIKILNNNGLVQQTSCRTESKNGLDGSDGLAGNAGKGGKYGNNKIDRYDTRDDTWVRRDGWHNELVESVSKTASNGSMNCSKNTNGQICDNTNLDKEAMLAYHVKEYVTNCNKNSDDNITKVLFQSFYDSQQCNKLFCMTYYINSETNLSGDVCTSF